MVLITLLHVFYNFGWNLMSLVGGMPMDQTLVYQAIVLTVYGAIIVAVCGHARLSRRESLPIDPHGKSWIQE
jgi:ABC-type long-subunit fatty acid transport system fused permease/ATPase subunit